MERVMKFGSDKKYIQKNEPEIIYILGSAYSGSTILGFILGSAPNVFNAGELIYYNQLQQQDEMCSCGVPSMRCDFWKSIYKLKLHINNHTSVWEKIHIVVDIALGKKQIGKKLNKDDLHLFQAVAKQSNSMGKPVRFVLDNSKRLVRLVHLQQLKVKVIYLRRDIYGNMSSFLKHGQRFGHALLKYLFYNFIMIKYVQRLEVDSLYVDYSRLCKNTDVELARLSQFLDIDLSGYPNAVRQERYHVPTGNHGTRAANLSGFSGLRYDNTWQGKLTKNQIRILKIVNYFMDRLC